MSRQKQKGTAFERMVANYMSAFLDDDRIDLIRTHGSMDRGDVGPVYCHGRYRGLVECKDYAEWGPSLLEGWKAETDRERGNADADFALLVVHKRKCGKSKCGLQHCYMTVRDLARISGFEPDEAWPESFAGMWVETTLGDACALIRTMEV